MHEPSLDEVDLQIIHAMQVNPRVPWARVARVIGTDAATVGRRWGRLQSSGTAWVSAYLPPAYVQTAMVDITAQSGNVVELARTIAADPEAVTVDVTTGQRDIVVTVVCSSEEAVSSYLLDRLGPRDGVASVHSHPATSVLVEASRWRVRALSQAQVTALGSVTAAPEPRRRRNQQFDRVLATALADDGRASAAEIAARHGYSVRKVREGISDLLAGRRLQLRTEIARRYSQWPVSAYYFISAPASKRDEAARRLAGIEENRAVIQVVGRADIVVGVWMSRLQDVAKLETAIEEALPEVRVIDRSVVMRTVKIGGHLVDDRGHNAGYVPLEMLGEH